MKRRQPRLPGGRRRRTGVAAGAAALPSLLLLLLLWGLLEAGAAGGGVGGGGRSLAQFSDDVPFRISWPGSEFSLPTAGVLYKEDHYIIMTTSDKEKYKCILPLLTGGDEEEEKDYQGPSPTELLEPLFKQSSCSYRIESYWTYEVCHGKHVRQYHEEKETGQKINIQEYYLGNMLRKSILLDPEHEEKESEKDSGKEIPTKNIEGQMTPYYAMEMGNGTPCSLRQNLPRSSSVMYVCHPEAKHEILSVTEVTTCEYEVVILTPLLCSHPKYRFRASPVNDIFCQSLPGSPLKPQNLLQLEQQQEMLKMPFRRAKEEEINSAKEDKFSSFHKPVAVGNPQLLTVGTTHISKLTDDQLIKEFLSGSYCFHGGVGWWRYEFCYGKYVHQYHKPSALSGSSLLTRERNRLPSREFCRASVVLHFPFPCFDEIGNYRPVANVSFLSKVVERVVADQLQALLDETNALDPFQSGFRPRYGTETALVALLDDLLREADGGNMSLLVLLDISAAFDTVDHGILLGRLSELGVGGLALAWLRSFLEDRPQRVQLGERVSAPWNLNCGVPQGSIISPMLFNIYMRPLGGVIRGCGASCHQYADDTQLYISFTPTSVDAVLSLQRCLETVLEWMQSNGLRLNPDKTEVLRVGGPSVSGIGDSLSFGGTTLAAKSEVRSLGIHLDPALTMETQVASVVRSAYFHLWRIAQLRPYLDRGALTTLVHALVISRLDHCNALYVGLPLRLTRKLQMVQNAAARLLSGVRKHQHISPTLAALHWLPIRFRADFKVLMITYKALNGLGPQYLADRLLPPRSTRITRHSQQGRLRGLTPREARKEKTRNRAFSAVAPRLWNTLPTEIRLAPSLGVFKNQLKTWLFKQAFPPVD